MARPTLGGLLWPLLVVHGSWVTTELQPFGVEMRHTAARFPSEIISALRDAHFPAALRKAFSSSEGLVVIPGLFGLSPTAMVEVVELLGEVETAPADGSYETVLEGEPRVHEFSKVPSSRVFDTNHSDADPKSAGDGSVVFQPLTGRPSWHTDQSFRSPPVAGSAMFCLSTPSDGSGATLFSGTTRALEALSTTTRDTCFPFRGEQQLCGPAAKERIENITAIHSYTTLRENFERFTPPRPGRILSGSREKSLPPATHPLAPPHPQTGRRALYLAPHVISSLSTLDGRESLRLVNSLTVHATQPQFVRKHNWRVGDLVIWDNRCTMHAATKVPEGLAPERVMWRATFKQQAPEGWVAGGDKDSRVSAASASPPVRVSLNEASDMVRRKLQAAGASETTCEALGEQLVAAEAMGKTSHGLRRTRPMVSALEQGLVNGSASPRLHHISESAFRADGDGGFAQLSLNLFLPQVLAAAEEHGHATLAVTNTVGISGSLGVSLHLAGCGRRTVMCMMFVNTPAYLSVAPGQNSNPPARLLGTNPIAVVWPSRSKRCIMDLALAAMSRGDMEVSAAQGKELPPGAALDSQGQPTRNASAALEGAQLAFGSHKGALLALAVEFLAGALTGSDLAIESSHWDNMNRGQLILAFDIAKLSGQTATSIIAKTDRLLEQLPRIPGEASASAEARASVDGLGIPADLHAWLLDGTCMPGIMCLKF